MMSADQTQTKSRRPLPLLLIGVLCLVMLGVVAVTGILYLPLRPLLPPESPEITARRQSSANGYYKLREAGALIPLNVYQSLYDPVSGDKIRIGQIWAEGWPAHPQLQEVLLDQFERLGPVIRLMREGLAAEYYLRPNSKGYDREPEYRAESFLLHTLPHYLASQAKWFEEQGKYEAAMANYLDIIRLGSTYGSDGAWSHGARGFAAQRLGLRALEQSIAEYDDPELLRRAVKTLTGFAREDVPVKKWLERNLRTLDDMIMDEPKFLSRLDDCGLDPTQSYLVHVGFLGKGIDKLMRRASLLRANWEIRDYIRESFAAAELPYTQAKNAYPAPPNDCGSEALLRHVGNVSVYRDTAQMHQTQMEGIILLLALRLYHIDHGSYPDRLNELLPEYLDSIPTDPFTGNPFHYENVGDDFRLYSYGRNGIDDGGVPYWYLKDQIIHLPREEWEALEAEG